MSELLYTSVKQLMQAHGCPRQWAFHNMFDAPYLPNEYADAGNQLHAQIDCLIKGTPPVHPPESRIGKMARELYQNYAACRSPEACSEMHRTIELPEWGIKVALRCDFFDLNPPNLPLPVFRDWKTTGAPGPKALLKSGEYWTPQDLATHWQTRIYAGLLMHVWELDRVQGELCFVCRKFDDGKAPKVWSVPHVFERAENHAWWDRMIPPVVQLIRDLRSAGLDNPLLVPHNGKHCEGTGHFCDVAGRCKFKSSPIMKYSDLHLPVLPTKGAT